MSEKTGPSRSLNREQSNTLAQALTCEFVLLATLQARVLFARMTFEPVNGMTVNVASHAFATCITASFCCTAMHDAG